MVAANWRGCDVAAVHRRRELRQGGGSGSWASWSLQDVPAKVGSPPPTGRCRSQNDLDAEAEERPPPARLSPRRGSQYRLKPVNAGEGTGLRPDPDWRELRKRVQRAIQAAEG